MSRRESRDSDSKRQRSRFDREPSPKRSRRDEKPEPEPERLRSNKDLEVREGGTESDKKPLKSLRDAGALEPDAHGLRQDGEQKLSGHPETAKRASHLSERPRSRPYDQHDGRHTAGKDDRRTYSERGSWRGSRDQSNRRSGDDEKSHFRKDEDKSTWRRDRFHENDDTQGALSRKRPAFSEKKIPEESRNNVNRTRIEEVKDTNLNNRRQNERSWRNNLHSERHERPAMGRDRVWNRDDERGRGYRADRGTVNSNGRSGFHGRDDKKWDHDLFEEANKSPDRATEEEQIAKVEALLAS